MRSRSRSLHTVSDCRGWVDDCDSIIFITDETRDQLRVPTPVSYHRGTNREYAGACSDWHGTPGDPNDPPGGDCDIRTELRPLGPARDDGIRDPQPALVRGSFQAIQLHRTTWTAAGVTYRANPNEFLWAVTGSIEGGGTMVVRCTYGLTAEARATAHAAWRNAGNISSYVGCGRSASADFLSRGWRIYE